MKNFEELRRTAARELREDIFTTLAISALLMGDNRSVQRCAANLSKRAPGSLRKNTLLPLSESRYALDIIMETSVFPTEDKIIGHVHHAGDEYDIVAKWRESFDYTIPEILGSIADTLVQRGFVDDRVHVSVIHPVYRGMHTDSISLKEHTRYRAESVDSIQQEA